MNSAARKPNRFLHVLLRTLFLVALLGWASAGLRAQGSPETIGVIEGPDIAVKGAVSVEVQEGRSFTVLASGSDITVRAGQARIALVEGGELGICGPAHLSLLKSGGAVTVALDYGRVHARLDASAPVTIYTPLIVATPTAIGSAPRDATVGLEPGGAMCVLAARGALRVEQQLTAETLLVPQSGELMLVGGQLGSLRGAAGGCQCEISSTPVFTIPPPRPPQTGLLAAAQPVSAKPAPPPAPKEPAKPEMTPEEAIKDLPRVEGRASGPPAREEPIYKVMMPPLSFDASKPAPPPDPSPETIRLVRQVRVRPAVWFRGHVEEAPAPPPAAKPAPPPVQVAANVEPPKKEPSVFARIRNFFRKVSGRGPCAGAGCS